MKNSIDGSVKSWRIIVLQICEVITLVIAIRGISEGISADIQRKRYVDS